MRCPRHAARVTSDTELWKCTHALRLSRFMLVDADIVSVRKGACKVEAGLSTSLAITIRSAQAVMRTVSKARGEAVVLGLTAISYKQHSLVSVI
jgi:hypothetical protein